MDGRSSHELGAESTPEATSNLLDHDAIERLLRRPIAQPVPPPRPHLVVIHGAGLGCSHAITDRSTTIGRAASSNVRVVDDSVSRTHATVTLDDGGIMRIRDEGSKNGILVNGVSVREAVLQRGDVIHVGGTMLAVAMLVPGMTAVDALAQVAHTRHAEADPEAEIETRKMGAEPS